MHIIATFENSLFLELMLTAMEQHGIGKQHILALPMDKPKAPRQLFDTIHHADGVTFVDLAAVLGTVFMLLGAIYGYLLRWGPILWGVIGAVSGMLLGFTIKYLRIRKKGAPRTASCGADVVVLVRCEPEQQAAIEQLMWEHHALGVSRYHSSPPALQRT
ncbi:hypothetical protein DUZ99_12435 [Xylanibacillus composti]|uniref:Uncharacterized protein n=1 Tax=Xylanibacillus composti TaxID=1572762 RepID=A0A8J4M159_9BACL|nr:hypothetical protein [Xylanibacillus composti]MDT9725779.1 hypothetical protein [Xylanibacillus composti]GIQ67507.1 hypothetical protein XYCOK13_03310 [Xylanibacillus composti]